MKAINQKIVDEFVNQSDLAGREGNMVQFIISRYHKESVQFHDVFLQSRFVLQMRDEDIQLMISNLREFMSVEVINSLVFINRLKHYIRHCDEDIQRLIKDGDISAEDLLYYYEQLIDKYKSEGKIFDVVPPHIAASQFEFLDGAFGSLIDIINLHAVPFKGTAAKERSNLREIMNSLFQKKSASNKFDSIAYKFYKAFYKDNCWVMEHTCPYWTKFEIYRDLNSEYFNKHDTSLVDSMNVS